MADKVFKNNPFEGLTGTDIASYGAGANSLMEMGQNAFGDESIDVSASPSIDKGSLHFSGGNYRDNLNRINGVQGSNFGSTIGSGIKGAGTGAMVGSAIMPGIGTAIGAGAGWVAGIGSELIGGRKRDREKREAEENAKNQFVDYTNQFNTKLDDQAMTASSSDRFDAIKNKYKLQPSFRNLR